MMPSYTSSSRRSALALLSIASAVLLPKACLAKDLPNLSPSKIVLEPVGIDPTDPFSNVHIDHSTKMLFGVVEPTTDDVLCTLSDLGGKVCQGGFTWDPTASDGTVEVTFRAPSGYVIELDLLGGIPVDRQVITFEFRALSGDRRCSDGAVRDGDATDVIMQSLTEVNSAAVDSTLARNLMEVGPCEIYTKVEVNAKALSSSKLPTGEEDKIRLESLSWTTEYDPNLFLALLEGKNDDGDSATGVGAGLEYVYKTNGGMWLKGFNPTLVKVDEPSDLVASVRRNLRH